MDEMSPMEGTEDMTGMMNAEEMQDLMDASDAEFQAMWLEMMIRHHEGAIEMAQVEQEDGHYEPAVTLASQIEKAQEAEIETMNGLLG